jgi:thermolabile hemolysin
MNTKPLFFTVFSIFFLNFSVFAQTADKLQEMVIFGDSLSDNGNYSRDAQKDGHPFPGRPYDPKEHKRASNGAVWPEYLSQIFLKIKLDDEAYIGAKTIENNKYYPYAVSLKKQVDNYIKNQNGNPIDGDHTLYVVWAGANNIFGFDQANPDASGPYAASGDVFQEILKLHKNGAKYFLVPGLPNFADIPLVNEYDPLKPAKTLFSMFSQFYNYETKTLIDVLNKQSSKTGLYILFSDVDALINDIQVKKTKNYGFTDTTTACYKGLPILPSKKPVCKLPNTHLFWDFVHPTTKGHCFLAYNMHNDLGNAGWTSKPPQEEFNYCVSLGLYPLQND